MITILNSVFDTQGVNAKDKVFGVTLSGTEDVLIKDCKFVNQGYSSVLNESTGNVTIENCEFDCSNVYNPIEGSQKVNNGNVSVKNCKFIGKPGNNFINFYQVAKDSKHLISGCEFNPSVDNNVIRISNRTSTAMNLKVENCKYDFLPGDVTDYTAFLLCQDYTNKSGIRQDFSKTVVELENILCNGEKVTAEGAAQGNIFYVYEDGAGLITGLGNDPVVIVK